MSSVSFVYVRVGVVSYYLTCFLYFNLVSKVYKQVWIVGARNPPTPSDQRLRLDPLCRSTTEIFLLLFFKRLVVKLRFTPPTLRILVSPVVSVCRGTRTSTVVSRGGRYCDRLVSVRVTQSEAESVILPETSVRSLVKNWYGLGSRRVPLRDLRKG